MSCRKRYGSEKSIGIERFLRRSLIWIVLLIVMWQEPVLAQSYNCRGVLSAGGYRRYVTLTHEFSNPKLFLPGPFGIPLGDWGWTLHLYDVSKSGERCEVNTTFIPGTESNLAAKMYKEACLIAKRVELSGAQAVQSEQKPTGQASQEVVFSDFDGDGIVDRANIASSNTVVVNLLAADGSIRSGKTFTIKVGTNIGYLQAADFNGDGKMDLAVSNAFSSFEQSGAGIFILLGNGDGTFQTAYTVSAGDSPSAIASGDFNGDGKPDLAVANFDSSVSVLLGKGDGTFQAPVASYLVGSYPESIVALDLNGDGKLDLAVYNYGSNTISVLLGTADGTFQPAVHSPGAPGLTGDGYLAWADLNHDSKLDLVLAYYYSNVLSVFLGKGDGSFQAPVNYAGPSVPASLAIGPQPDGSFSLFAANNWTGEVFALYSPGDGTLNAPVMEVTGKAFTNPATGDLNGDGVPDLVVGDQGMSTVVVRLNDGLGSLQAPVSYALPSTPQAVAIVDVNGDSKSDILAIYSDLLGTTSGLAVFPNQGSGTFGGASLFPAGDSPGNLVVADLNHDGIPDVVVISNPADGGQPAGIAVMLGNGTGGFGSPVPYSFGTQRAVSALVGDFNSDGHPDIAVATFDPLVNHGPGTLVLLTGKGDGTFQAGPSQAIGNPSTPGGSLAVGDFNRDGKLDIAVAGYSFTLNQNGKYLGNGVETLLGKGDGTFSTGAFVSTVYAARPLTVADVNGDGIADLINTGCCGESATTILLGNGDGSFKDEEAVFGPQSPNGAAMADFNLDGRPDMVITSKYGYALLGNPLDFIAVTPQPAVMQPLQTWQFSAQAFFKANKTVTWSLNPQVGTITPGGLYTAPASITAEQTVQVIATSSTGQIGLATILLVPGSSNCTYALHPSNTSVGVAGGTGTLSVSTQSGCQWLVLNGDRFVTITSPGSGTGSGSVSFSLAPNTATARTAKITVGGSTVIVYQNGLFGPPFNPNFDLYLPMILK
jgi:hypothetical protein